MITWISIGGVALGVIALIVSTSVMNGFRSNLRDAVTGSLPHITLFSWDEEIGAYNSLKKKVLEHPEVVAATAMLICWHAEAENLDVENRCEG